jgi:pimeloyl-ACP methyl ester carboxylesterase
VFRFWRPALSTTCLILGILLSRQVEPNVRFTHVVLAGQTPALRFSPRDSASHPLALLAHGVTASKETLFRFGEALAAAGFVCYAVDLPGHGESPKRFSPRENVRVLSQIAGDLGAVDVFVGHSMGAGAGAASVLNGGLNPRIFIAAGAVPDFGDHSPQLLLLAGRFEELIPPSEIAVPADARLVVSPWSDHALEPYDPLLVNAAVAAACGAVGATPPPPPTRWIWRLTGCLLAAAGAVSVVIWLPPLPEPWIWARGALVAAIVITDLALTTNTWLGAAPVARRLPMQAVFVIIVWLILSAVARLRLPRWLVPAVGAAAAFILAVATMCAPATAIWKPHARFFALVFALGALVMLAGTAVGWLAARRGVRRDGDTAMAIFIGYALGQWVPTLL